MVSSQLFVATHQQASAFARGAGVAPEAARRVDLNGLSEIEIEDLGVLAVQAVHASGADTALGLVDIDLDALSVVPEPVVEAFTELKNAKAETADNASAEQNPKLDELAKHWAEREDAEVSAVEAAALVTRISGLASAVASADEDERLGLYYLGSV
ncbi:hypothetical protein ODZ83_09665 [Acaricomes phytoseiuli]|uniref:hypothetical protein n=1 Tax=Acaricomes phytoseiuli TaxID=291968 RepID=UPI00038191DE|nr:hypothetical protein [Acaricomes phytoseiuli]MCW1250438.1 hypothetical protein [Acaricomes phytoseiuli]